MKRIIRGITKNDHYFKSSHTSPFSSSHSSSLLLIDCPVPNHSPKDRNFRCYINKYLIGEAYRDNLRDNCFISDLSLLTLKRQVFVCGGDLHRNRCVNGDVKVRGSNELHIERYCLCLCVSLSVCVNIYVYM